MWTLQQIEKVNGCIYCRSYSVCWGWSPSLLWVLLRLCKVCIPRTSRTVTPVRPFQNISFDHGMRPTSIPLHLVHSLANKNSMLLTHRKVVLQRQHIHFLILCCCLPQLKATRESVCRKRLQWGRPGKTPCDWIINAGGWCMMGMNKSDLGFYRILLDCISFLFAISVCRNNYLLVWHLFHPQQNLQAVPVEELRKQRGRDLFQQDPKFGESQNEFNSLKVKISKTCVSVSVLFHGISSPENANRSRVQHVGWPWVTNGPISIHLGGATWRKVEASLATAPWRSQIEPRKCEI